MPVKIACPECSKTYTLPDSAVGKAVKCKACGMSFRTRKPDSAAQPAAPATPVTPARPAARSASPAARPAQPAQPVSPDLGQFGVEGGFQPQADIFGAPPSPRGGSGLANFAEEGLGEAVVPIVLGPEGGTQTVEDNPFQSVMTNSALKRNGGKLGGLRRKKGSSGASFDPDRYNVARIGMMIVLGSGAVFLVSAVFSVVVSLLQLAIPGALESLAVVIGVVGLIISLLGFAAMLAFGVGQLICVFAPENNEKMNAGGSLGLFFMSVVGGFIGMLVMGASFANMSGPRGMGGAPTQAEAAAMGIGFLVIGGVCALMGLASVFLFANYYRVIGKNIRSKELVSAGTQGMVAIGVGVGLIVVLVLVAFLAGLIGASAGATGILVVALMVCFWLAGFVIYLMLLRMVMVGVRVLKA